MVPLTRADCIEAYLAISGPPSSPISILYWINQFSVVPTLEEKARCLFFIEEMKITLEAILLYLLTTPDVY